MTLQGHGTELNGTELNDVAELRRAAVVIEDDPDVSGFIEEILRQAGFRVSSASSGIDGVDLVRSLDPDVVTLDIGLTDIDGVEVARRIRLFSDCYIVMLTAQSSEADLLVGLGSGADDYLTKPFRPRELRIRVEALMRRPRASRGPVASGPVMTGLATPGTVPMWTASPAVAAVPPAMTADVTPPASRQDRETPGETVYVHNGLVLDADTRTVEVDGSEIALTRTEFDLLRSLLQSRRRIRSKADLVRALRDDDEAADAVTEAEERVLEVHLANLRRKLADDAMRPRWIETVRGMGYRLSPAIDG